MKNKDLAIGRMEGREEGEGGRGREGGKGGREGGRKGGREDRPGCSTPYLYSLMFG